MRLSHQLYGFVICRIMASRPLSKIGFATEARAKALLRIYAARFTEFEITENPRLTAEMEERSGRTTVPQIFIAV